MKDVKFDMAWCLLIFGACGLLYYHTLDFQLTYLDDNVWLLDYRWYLQNKTNAFSVFLKPDLLFGGIFYRPLIYLSFILDTMAGVDSWLMYRITNLVLHAVNSSLFYGFLRAFGHKQRAAGWAALCFAVHPVLTQAVVWIPGRTDSLLALCVLASFLGLMRYARTGKYLYLGLHAVFLMLAFLTKETAVALPCMSFVYVMLCTRREISVRTIGFLSAGWIIILAGYFALRKSVLGDMANVSPELAIHSILFNSPAAISYLGKIFFPVRLSVLPMLSDMSLVSGWIALGLLAGLCFFPSEKDRKKMLFAALWFVVFLVPSFVGSFITHEYRAYIPMVGIILFVLKSGVMQSIAGRAKTAGTVAAVAVILVLGRMTWANAEHYKDRHAFWDNAVATSPHSPLAHRNRGAMYFIDEKFDEAEKEFRAALALNPREYMVNNNLGLIYERRGDGAKAEEAYRREIEINPSYDNVYYNLGLFYGKQKRYDLAVKAWQKAAELNPRNLMAHKYLAVYFTKTKDRMKAEFHISELERQGVSIPADIDALIRKDP